MEENMEAGVIKEFIGFRIFQHLGYLFRRFT